MKFYASFPITPENCLSNRAINYGDGLFETILLCHQKIALWDLHFKRLNEGLARLNLESIPKALIHTKILSLINDDNCYVIKLVVFRDGRKRGYGSQAKKVHFYITVNPFVEQQVSQVLTVSSIQLSRQKNLAGLKHLNRLEQVLAAQKLNGCDYSDAIMLNDKQHVIETISKNILLIKDQKIYTPKLNKCGVYGVALSWLQKQGYKLIRKKIEFKSMQKYDGLMVCNSIVGFTSISKIDNKIEYKKQLSIAKDIQNQWKELRNI